MPPLEIASPEKTCFRLKHADKVIECSGASPLLSESLPSSDRPNQLWSKIEGVKGQCFINRGTGAYLEAEKSKGVVQSKNLVVETKNGTNVDVLPKIEDANEWNVQEQGASVRLETPDKLLLKATHQRYELSPNADADTLFVIDYVPNPALSVGSEHYVDSPEHTCVANHVFNAVNALNAIIHILEHPMKHPTSNADALLAQYTVVQFQQFKARGREVTLNFDFAIATVASWFLHIGAKIEAEDKTSGGLSKANKDQDASHDAADASLTQLKTTHQKTLDDIKDQQTKYDRAKTEYNNAVPVYDAAVKKKERVEDMIESIDEDTDQDYSSNAGSALGAATGLAVAEKELKIAKEKKDSWKHERDEAEKLLTTLNGNSTTEAAEMKRLQGIVDAANSTVATNKPKLAELKAHHSTLADLQNSITDCRTHLANTLEYKVGSASSLTLVLQTMKGIVGVLRKDDDFKGPLKILEAAGLDKLVEKIPHISQHAIAGK